MTRRTPRALIGAVAALAVVPAAASAGTIAYEGDTLVLRAAPGEANSVTLSGEEPGRLALSDAALHAFPADRCRQDDPSYAVQCDVPRAVRLELGDRDDRLVVSHTAPAGLEVTGLGGDGRDELKAIDGQTRITFDGGAGADVLRSEGGADVLRGGADADELAGGPGADVLEGGDGDDELTGDACGAAAPDVLDGGPGRDTLTDWGDCGPGSDRRPVSVSVNGKADDGRPGEGDDVRDFDDPIREFCDQMAARMRTRAFAAWFRLMLIHYQDLVFLRFPGPDLLLARNLLLVLLWALLLFVPERNSDRQTS